jgi:hypothetical protein
MYLGYMKKGLQTMFLFVAPILVGYVIGFLRYFNELAMIFLFFLPIIWLYQFFDSMHTVSRLKKQGIEFPTDDGFYMPQMIKMDMFSPTSNPKMARILAGVLICVGCFGLFFGFLEYMQF